MPKLSIICFVQIQCTIALASHAQTEGKVSDTRESWLHAIIEKHFQYFCGICRAGLWSAIPRCTKEYTWQTNWCI